LIGSRHVVDHTSTMTMHYDGEWMKWLCWTVLPFKGNQLWRSWRHTSLKVYTAQGGRIDKMCIVPGHTLHQMCTYSIPILACVTIYPNPHTYTCEEFYSEVFCDKDYTYLSPCCSPCNTIVSKFLTTISSFLHS
jgi:hypothetical protein